MILTGLVGYACAAQIPGSSTTAASSDTKRCLMVIAFLSVSCRPRSLHHFPPALVFGADEAVELLRAARRQGLAERLDAPGGVRRAERLPHRGAEGSNALARCGRRNDYAVPLDDVGELGIAGLESARHLGDGGIALAVHDAKSAQLARLHVRHC